MTALPNARLLAKAFHRTIPSASTPATRHLSTSSSLQAWTGRQPEDNTVRETDSNNVQQDAVRDGKADRASSDAADSGNKSGATSEKDVKNNNQKAKEENPEAPGPVIGMNDERGGKGA